MTDRHLRAVTAPTVDETIGARVAELVAKMKAERGRDYDAALASQALIPCPRCGALAGADCKTSGGYVVIGVHAGRRNAIARMGVDERLAAYAERVVWQQHAQASIRDYFSKPLPAHVLAAREQFNRAWKEMREQQRAAEREMRRRCRDPYLHRKDCTCRIDTEEQR